MLHDRNSATEGFVPLPNEKTIFKSSHRTSLSLTAPKTTYPAHSSNVNINSSDGTCYLTNQRIVYLPKTSSEAFSSFSCPLLNLHDTHLVMPWFGPNAWTALVKPVAGGNIPSGSAYIELKLTFKEGGAPDFQSKFEAIKERLQQVVDVARQTNTDSRRVGNDGMGGVNLAAVHLDELPRYEDSGHDRIAPQTETRQEEEVTVMPANATSDQVRAMAAAHRQQQEQRSRQNSRGHSSDNAEHETPSDAPPGYEEAQQQSVQAEMEWRTEGRS